eukprot:TRINITY_DN7026_c0_g1_i1.p1 TRINITY_DN7026_c0_g1~~TRINITY_DN7026_c0_g1_i1.p1  ORF type:complete len:603 (-),score=117.74 TRINITY_DN7026_c0_g1_i1:320-2128(-)
MTNKTQTSTVGPETAISAHNTIILNRLFCIGGSHSGGFLQDGVIYFDDASVPTIGFSGIFSQDAHLTAYVPVMSDMFRVATSMSKLTALARTRSLHTPCSLSRASGCFTVARFTSQSIDRTGVPRSYRSRFDAPYWLSGSLAMALGAAGAAFGASRLQASAEERPSSLSESEERFDPSRVFAKKSTAELLFTCGILYMCSFESLVHFGTTVLEFSKKIHCEAPVYWIVKKTFFRQFCAGEELPESLAVAEKLYNDFRVGSILDYSVESGDGDFDQAARNILATVDAAARHPLRIPFSCMKLTGLTSDELLRHMSDLLVYQLANPGFQLPWTAKDAFWSKRKASPAAVSGHSSPPPPLSEAELRLLKELQSRLDTIGAECMSRSVRLLVDAEQSYLQPAIDYLTLEMVRKFNTRQPIVHNTYQMYLRDGVPRLEAHLDAAQRSGVFMGVKLVRGAYMVSENRLAAAAGLPSPVLGSLADTHASYNAGVAMMLDRLDRASVLMATHNEESLRTALRLLGEKQVPRDHPHFAVGQLYGMCDHLSLQYAQRGFHVAKYVPFGPVHEVIPYLIRRMQENRDVVSKSDGERAHIIAELKRRMFFWRTW